MALHFYEGAQIFEFYNSLVIIFLYIRKLHICNQDYFLSEIIKCDDLVKKHQVNVLKSLRVCGIEVKGRL